MRRCGAGAPSRGAVGAPSPDADISLISVISPRRARRRVFVNIFHLRCLTPYFHVFMLTLEALPVRKAPDSTLIFILERTRESSDKPEASHIHDTW